MLLLLSVRPGDEYGPAYSLDTSTGQVVVLFRTTREAERLTALVLPGLEGVGRTLRMAELPWSVEACIAFLQEHYRASPAPGSAPLVVMLEGDEDYEPLLHAVELETQRLAAAKP